MTDPTLADPLAAPPFDADFFSDLPLSFDDLDNIDFTFDDFSLPDDFPSDPIDFSADVAGFLNDSSPDDPSRVSDFPSPGPASSQGSGNSENSGNFVSPDSVLPSNFTNGAVDQKVKSEEESNNLVLKRKKHSDLEIRSSKYRRASAEGKSVVSDEDEKRKARLVRNRESAQLSRQRKKHYVEELEDKVRAMHSTIQDLNSRISYVMAENATLRMQASGAPPPGMYPPPPMGYPWVPCPPYMMKPQGSQVPLVPIPRLKSKQPASAPKVKSKTKKVASVSFLGLLFFLILFGGLVPMVNFKFREMNGSVPGTFHDQQQGKGLRSVNSSDRDTRTEKGKDFVFNGQCGEGVKMDGEKRSGNSSEPLVASLYVPRNDKLVKIDGNLIIHSIMASEKAMSSSKEEEEAKRKEETGLAVAVPNIIPLSGRNIHSHPYSRALSGEKDKMISSAAADGNLQQWFMEGLAGPMLSSGMCTEVFEYNVSPSSGAIVPAGSVMNATSETQHSKNITTKLTKGRNRRILYGAPVPLVSSESNTTERPVGIDHEKDNFGGNNSLSSMVVSVLVDPREAGDGVGDGVMGRKSLPRIFVVVLIDSVKYVTYSCMLPLIGSGAHLTT